MKQELKIWLQSPNKNYKEGLKLFLGLKINPKKNAFFQNPNPQILHRGLLLAELSRYNRIYNKAPLKEEVSKKAKPSKQIKKISAKLEIINKEIETGRVIIDKNPHVSYDILPDELKKSYDENGKNYSEIKSLHAQLKSFPDDTDFDAKRRVLLNEIVTIQSDIRKNWDKIDKWASGQPIVDDNQPTIPSGKLSLNQINQIANPAIKALSKKLRIDANINYIRRYSKDISKEKELKIRIAELNEWEIDYEKRIRTN